MQYVTNPVSLLPEKGLYHPVHAYVLFLVSRHSYSSFTNVFQEAVPIQGVTNPVSLLPEKVYTRALSFSSCLRFLSRLPVTLILPSVTCFRRQFLCKV